MRCMVFWGTRLAMSIAFHPQVDGWTEQINRIFEDMLQDYVNPVQNDWDEFLPMVELVYNGSWQKSPQNTPFVLNTNQHPMTLINEISRCQVLIAKNFDEHMYDVIGQEKKKKIVAQ